MSNITSRHIQVNDWIFEIKMVRAIKVNDYGQPYSAIANFNINGDSAYIDGLMTSNEESFNRDDYQTFVKFCQQLEIKKVKFDRFKNHQLKSLYVDICPPECQIQTLQLVQ